MTMFSETATPYPIEKRRKSRKEENPNDFYQTPIPVVKSVLDLLHVAPVEIGTPEYILDPGAGTGRWGEACRQRWPDSEIVGVEVDKSRKRNLSYSAWVNADFRNFRDGRSYSLPGIYDLVIGNPPYSISQGVEDKKLAEKFIRVGMHTLVSGGWLVFLLKTVFTEAQERFEGLFCNIPPRVIYQSAPRIPWDAQKYGKHTNPIAYSVFMWQKDVYMHDTILRWFDWRNDRTRIVAQAKMQEITRDES